MLKLLIGWPAEVCTRCSCW